MIPVRLSLRNFMCYRDNVPPLDFTGIHLACLWGDNGNGKSALIDAITWALWGKSRAKSDDDLIHSTQSEMEVEFDFAVAGQTYRIIRKRAKARRPKGQGQSSLDLLRFSSDGYKTDSGNSIIQTQQKIVDLLHMDYETFINSAYLRQGHADEFTVKRPSERKEVLAYILGLSFYDDLEKQAKELAREQDSQKALLENAIREINEELALRPTYEAELEQAQLELSRIEGILAASEAALKALRQQTETLVQKKSQLDELEMRRNNTRKDLALWQEQVTQHQSRIKEYEELIAKRATIEDGYNRYTQAKKLSEELDNRFRQSVSLERRKSQLESKIQQAVSALNSEHTMTQRKIQELETKANLLTSLKNQFQQVNAQLRQLTEQEETLKSKRQALQELQAQASYLESGNHQLEREISEVTEKISLLATRTEARCPLCETELGIGGIKLIESKFNTEKQSKSVSLGSSREELAQKEAARDSLQKEIASFEAHLNQDRTATQHKASVLGKEIDDAEKSAKEMAERKEYLAEIEQRLVRRDFVSAEDTQLGEIEAELTRLAYSTEQHEKARQSAAEFAPYEQSQRKLEEAERLIPQERDYASRAEEAVRKAQQSLEADEQKQQKLSEELVSLPGLLAELAKVENENRELTGQRNRVQEGTGSIKAKLQRCSDLELKKKEKETAMLESGQQEGIYKELAEAFGKGGIQALLIEMALPEIEIEANRLLSRMTDNRMHLKFETQREKKTGGVIETLDIKISDDLGMRNYEMFSGGEAFRINFAVRIALSRLLAKRAGAPLRTLIIDEGFGTQDSAGIEKLKEAINSIQDDFDKIIVITHIEELRDAFPVRIDVTKTAEGSMISVS